MKKKTVISLILASLSIVPFYAQAADLFISNNTQYDSTSVINSLTCSTMIGDEGITKAGAQNHKVSAANINKACYFFPHDCKADVYLATTPGQYCKGPVIATVTFDVDSGIKSTVNKAPGYKVSGSGFNIQLDPA